MKKPKPIYTLDLETDPFLYGRFPLPFAVGLYAEGRFQYTWGSNCVEQMKAKVELLPPGIIYIHNGGRFDLFYMLDWIVPETDNSDEPNIFAINRRIVKAYMECGGGRHEIRDSYSIMPFPLKNYKKKEMDYSKMERDVRELYRDEILEYLEGDCVYLWELAWSFVEMFGDKLTIGSTSMGELQKLHSFASLDSADDSDIRNSYYYGGRVQCFKKGIFEGHYKIYDVNSMYPFVMQSYKHPISKPGWESEKVSKFTYFLTVEGKNYGAFPTRERGGGIRFDRESGIFHITIHEWKAALAHGLFEPRRIIRCLNFDSADTFKGFVNHFYNARLQAKTSGDSTHALFYKYILNSAYGKFAQNPENYFEYKITRSNDMPASTDVLSFCDDSYRGWRPSLIPNGTHILWERPTTDFKRFNVATAASITGAARAVLMEAIANSSGLLYCDTDSVICESVKGVNEDSEKLGAWKCEAEATRVCIAGKKLYAVFDGDKCVKQANKGVNVTADQIVEVCEGKTILSRRDAPTFSLAGNGPMHRFIERKVRML